MKTNQQTPYGNAHIELINEVVQINAETDLATFWAQGFATAKLRLWQLDLSRRVAKGELAEILGRKAYKTDLFQRKLGLRELAQREIQRTKEEKERTGEESLQVQQIGAYLDGINQALSTLKILPFECTILRYRPKPFTFEDVYAIAHLKYFINSAWQYELYHTNILKRINATQANQLFATVAEEGDFISPMPYAPHGEREALAEKAFQEGLEGLRLLGLASPDTGSNVFAIRPELSETNEALLASDPHMGQVNPNFSLLFKLKSQEGLNVFGSNFPGVPGILVGRNESASWGMVGIMADNQDLSYAEINWDRKLVKENGEWIPLHETTASIAIKGRSPKETTHYHFERGRLIEHKGNYGLFLRWPALDSPLGDITLYQLAKCQNWQDFKSSIAHIYNAPMMVGYADSHGDIGLHVVGLLPKRKKGTETLGSILQNQDSPASQWDGYLSLDELPSQHNPQEDYVLYANQYSHKLFDDYHPLSNRWHPPSRAHRIQELLMQKGKLSADNLMTIQDDKVDVFARNEIGYFLSFMDENTLLSDWQGDTTEIEKNQLFERWIYTLAYEICHPVLGKKAFALYTDFWPSYRWCVLKIFKEHLRDWLSPDKQEVYDENPDIFRKVLAKLTYKKANIEGLPTPSSVFQHSIKEPPLLNWLLTGKMKYFGGNRETVFATRQNTDFLTSSQTNFKDREQKPYSFGPAFQFVSEMNHQQIIHYAINTPAKGTPFFWKLNPNLKRWQAGKRYKKHLI